MIASSLILIMPFSDTHLLLSATVNNSRAGRSALRRAWILNGPAFNQWSAPFQSLLPWADRQDLATIALAPDRIRARLTEFLKGSGDPEVLSSLPPGADSLLDVSLCSELQFSTLDEHCAMGSLKMSALRSDRAEPALRFFETHLMRAMPFALELPDSIFGLSNIQASKMARGLMLSHHESLALSALSEPIEGSRPSPRL